MNRIRLLSEQVANQIAAGEVVERPASVVKELVENALDARATRVQVDIQAGGRSLIRVTDDGLGMSRDDALLCLERHATSKILKAEDLEAVTTMGFRGEALPSIASVSRFTLTTRERDGQALEAVQISVNGGKILEVKTAGAPTGTCVEVRQLFFNLPARRKFLRTQETEWAHIQHYLTLAALAHPEVAFTVTHEGRVTWQLPSLASADRATALAERLRVFQGEGQPLLKVESTGTLPSEPDFRENTEAEPQTTASKLTISGFIGAPGVARATRDQQHLFVNRRPVENRGLNHALLEGYHNALMKGRYPVCCLFLEIDPAQVDVNIHPAKREIKFHQERLVRKIVAEAVRQTLLAFHSAAPVEAVRSSPPVQSSNLAPARYEPARPVPVAPSVPSLFRLEPTPHPTAAPPAIRQTPLAMGFSTRAETTAPIERNLVPIAAPVPLLAVPLRLVGVIGKLYVVLESDRGLVLLDQHAAHERILYEQMLARLEQGPAPSQGLLLPETVELPARDAQFLREQLPLLVRLGVGLSEFGERTFLLDALPPFVKVSDARRFTLELIDELKVAGQEVNSWRLGEQVIAKTVCRHAVKANDPLTGAELENLVNDLRRCTMPYTCPHGRPTLIEMNLRELGKKFGRIP